MHLVQLKMVSQQESDNMYGGNVHKGFFKYFFVQSLTKQWQKKTNSLYNKRC